MYALLPDLDAALVAFLTSHPSLAPLHAGRVGTRLAAGTDPALRVTPLGGTQAWPWEVSQEFQIESWGGEQGDAKLLDRTVAAAVWDLVGATVSGGHVSGVAVRLASLWQPDDQTGRARYRTDIALTAMP